MTDDFGCEIKLHFETKNTGWSSADYVFYRSLDNDWDHAWVVEPEGYFANGSIQIFAELRSDYSDLVATEYFDAGNWTKRFQSAHPAAKVKNSLPLRKGELGARKGRFGASPSSH